MTCSLVFFILQRIKGTDTSISSPSTPVHEHQHRRTVSSPFELSYPEPCDHLTADVDLGQPDVRKEKSATIPRTNAETEQDAQLFKPAGILKPPSNASVYDNVTCVPLRKSESESRGAPSRKSMPSVGSTHVSFVVDNLLQNTRPASAIHFTEQFYENQKNEDKLDKNGKSHMRSQSVQGSRSHDNVRMETAFVGDVVCPPSVDSPVTDNVTILAPQPLKPGTISQKTSTSESPEWPSPPEPLTPLTPVNPTCNVDFDSSVLKRMLQSLPVSPDEVVDTSDKDQGFHEDLSLTDSPHHDSEEMIRRAKSFTSHDREKGERECSAFFQRPSVSVLASLDKSQGPKTPIENVRKTLVNQNGSSKNKQTKLLIENELLLRNKCARESYGRESYPDSGVGGMTVDTAGSVWSSGSLKPTHSGECMFILLIIRVHPIYI